MLLLAIPALGCVELAKTLRWRVLIGAERPPFARCLRALVAGQLVNALVPVRAGEVLSIGLLRAEGGPLVAGTASLAGTKALDALCLAAIAAAVLGAIVVRQLHLALLVAAGVVLAGIALAAVYHLKPAWLPKLAWARKLHLHELREVAGALRHWRVLLLVAVTTSVVWLAGLAANWLVLLGAGIGPSLDAAARMLVAGYVVGTLPAPPGRIGVFEAGIVAALLGLGVAADRALTAAVALHVCQLVELALLLGSSLAWTKWGRAAGPMTRPAGGDGYGFLTRRSE